MRSLHELLGADGLRPLGTPDFQLAAPAAAGGSAEQTGAPSGSCPTCAGAGWYTKPVPYGHPDFAKLVACDCTRGDRAQKHQERLRAISNLGAFGDKTFAAFDPDIPGVREAYARAVAFARRPVGWLALFGPYGSGKTHLAAAVAHAALDHGAPVLFVVVPDLLDHLRAAFQPGTDSSYDAEFELVRSVALLILDDLGTESPTPWAREKLYQLVNHRSNERLPTVLTSNVRPEQLDARIVSRLHDPALGDAVVTIRAGDYRRRRVASGGRP